MSNPFEGWGFISGDAQYDYLGRDGLVFARFNDNDHAKTFLAMARLVSDIAETEINKIRFGDAPALLVSFVTRARALAAAEAIEEK